MRALLTLAFAATAFAAQATVLLFEKGPGPTFANLSSDDLATGGYGSRVTAESMGSSLYRYGSAGGFTPNIVASYQSSANVTVSGWSTGYGNLVNSIWGNGNSSGVNTYTVTLTADPGWFVRFDGFHAAAWSSNQPDAVLTLRGASGNVLFSYTGPLVLGNGRDIFDFSNNPFIDTTISLTVSQGWYHSIDNVQFAQTDVIPEPATLAILAGAAALAARRKRKA